MDSGETPPSLLPIAESSSSRGQSSRSVSTPSLEGKSEQVGAGPGGKPEGLSLCGATWGLIQSLLPAAVSFVPRQPHGGGAGGVCSLGSLLGQGVAGWLRGPLSLRDTCGGGCLTHCCFPLHRSVISGNFPGAPPARPPPGREEGISPSPCLPACLTPQVSSMQTPSRLGR